MMYQPWCPQYPEWDEAWSYENYPSKLTTVLPEFYDFADNTHHFDNRGSTTSRGRNEIVAADNQRFEGYIDGCGMCGSIGHAFNDCPILQEPPPPFKPQLIQQNNMQFQQNIIATVQELIAQIGQLATTINQLQFEDSGQVPSQAILSPQENISDITVRSDMELPQQQSLEVQYGFFGNPDSENSTTMLGFVDSSSVANSMLATTNSTKMAEIDDYVPTIYNLVDVIKIANSMHDVTNLTDMTLDEILDQMADPRYANADNAFAEGVEDADSMVDKSENVNMTESVDSMVEGLDLPDKIANSDLADSRKRDEVTIDSNIQEEAIAKSNNLEGASSKSNNQEAIEPNFRSRNHKQAENEPVPNCRDSTRAESDSNNKTNTESDSNKQSQKQLKAEMDSAI
ncbi:hypothetical protein CR513_45616, partial [Mucuna pruriens]